MKDIVLLEWSDDGGFHSRELRDIAMVADDEHDSYEAKVLHYFRAQLDLFSKMCFYRQYLGISKVKEHLPIHIVLQ